LLRAELVVSSELTRCKIMSREILFKDILVGFHKKPIKECEVAFECNSGNYRLYVDKRPEDNHFYAYAVEFASCSFNAELAWDCPNLKVTPLFNVTAYHDGVRHLEFDREDEDSPGYIYYPNMKGFMELIGKVREIEVEVCRDCD